MYRAILSDFSRVLLKPSDTEYRDGLNALHKKHVSEKGEAYDIFQYFVLNVELLDFYMELRNKYSLSLFTTDIIQNNPKIRIELDKVFENIFVANDYGLNKAEPSAYSFVAEKIGIKPVSIIYIDDQEKNVEAATKAGLKALQYRDDNMTLINEIKGLLTQ